MTNTRRFLVTIERNQGVLPDCNSVVEAFMQQYSEDAEAVRLTVEDLSPQDQTTASLPGWRHHQEEQGG